MKKEKFGNIFRFLPKSKIKAGEGKKEGKYPFFKSGKDQSKRIDYAIFSGESLILGDGGDANIVYYNGDFSASDHCYIAQANDKNEVYTKYVYYYLKSHIHILQAGFKGVGLKNISKKYLSNIKIPFPKTLDEQIKIANLLTQVETLIAKREESIRLLDELLKSTFLDMFGDPILNPKGWKKLPLIKVSDFENGDRSSKYPSGNDLVEQGILFLNTKNIINNTLDLTHKIFITKEKFESLSKGKVKFGDILITLRGTLGNCCIYNSKEYMTAFINAQMMIISPNTKIINNIFLHNFLTSERINNLFKELGNGAAVPQLTAKQLKKLEVVLPPKPLQDKFATIVQQVEETKKHYQKSLDELNQLFGSLSQRAFKGELDLSQIELLELEEPESSDNSNSKLGVTVTKEQLDSLKNSAKRVSEAIKTNELKAVAKQLETISKLPAVGDAVKRASMLAQSFKSFNIPTLNIEIPKFYKNITSFDFNSISTFNTFQQTIQKLRERVEHIYQMLEDIPQIKEAMESGVLSRDDFLELPLRYDYEYSQIKRIIMNKLSSGELRQHFDESSKKIKLVKPE